MSRFPGGVINTMRQFGVYIYQHVPKCGGRSFIRICRKHMNKLADSPPGYPTKKDKAEFAKSKKDLTLLPPKTLLHGHLIHKGIRPMERYEKELREGSCAVITVIRDPLERALSEFFHGKARGKGFQGSLSVWLARHKNNMCEQLGIEMEGVKPRWDPFLMIGLTERLQQTIDLFASIADFPSETIEHINSNPRDPSLLAGIEKREFDAFREANSKDFALYNYALERLERQSADPNFQPQCLTEQWPVPKRKLFGWLSKLGIQ